VSSYLLDLRELTVLRREPDGATVDLGETRETCTSAEDLAALVEELAADGEVPPEAAEELRQSCAGVQGEFVGWAVHDFFARRPCGARGSTIDRECPAALMSPASRSTP
jgi:hypothetical protein